MRKLIFLLLLVLIVVIVGPFIYVNFFSLGSVLSDGRGQELYYKDGVSKKQADELFKRLGTLGVFSGEYQTKVQVLKEDGNIVLRLPIDEKIWENEEVYPEIAASGEFVSQEVFNGTPVVVEMCTEDLKTGKRVEAFDELAAREPEKAYLAESAFNTKLGDKERQIRCLERGVEKNRDNPALLNELAYAEAENGQYKSALEHARASLKARPNHPGTLDTLGYVQVGLGRYKQAYKTYLRALEASNGKGSAHIHLGLAEAYSKLGHRSKAREHEKLARKINPDLKLKWPPDLGI